MLWLNRIEQIGNRLPQPASLFLLGMGVIFLLSSLAHHLQWSVEDINGEMIVVNNLLSGDGLWWLCANLVENFITFPPLGIVLVGMLGIGFADRVGLLATLLREVILRVPKRLLTPATILLGILSSITLDAGYVVLPPIAASLYLAAGRSPLAGIAAVFAGISAGFSANFSITALDPMLAGITQLSARMLVVDYVVAVTANWWFMIVSTCLLTLTGWYISVRFVEPTLTDYTVTDSTLSPETDAKRQGRGLQQAGLLFIALIMGVVLLVNLPGAALYGDGQHFARWIEATVPLLFLLFLLPGIWYGVSVGTIKTDRDVVRLLGESMGQLGPYIVLAFFAAQFIESFHYSGLGKILALAGGAWLSTLEIPQWGLLSTFVLMVMLLNLLIGSASAKYALIAPIFVPMLMQVDMSPELTQAAYRVGDSISNVITPLNPYMIIILVQFQRYSQRAGLGTLIAAMLPYAIGYCMVWLTLLLIWSALGIPLGPQ